MALPPVLPIHKFRVTFPGKRQCHIVRQPSEGDLMPFTIANVFSGTFSSIRKGFIPLLIVTLLLYLGPNLLAMVGLRLGMGISLGTMAALQGSNLAITLAVMLVMYFLVFVHISSVTEITVLTATDQPVRLGAIMKHGVVNAIPIFVIYLLCGLGWMITSLFLLVPGFIFGTIFSVVLPAYVAERAGIFKAFGRSRTLTKGRRWGIFGFWFLILVIFYILMLAIEMPFLMPMMRQAMQAQTTGQAPTDFLPPLSLMILMTIAGSLISVILLMINASVYNCLRFEKERYTGANVEKVFE
jgi:hypothetical protein